MPKPAGLAAIEVKAIAEPPHFAAIRDLLFPGRVTDTFFPSGFSGGGKIVNRSEGRKEIGRRELLRRLAAGAGASVALPAQGRAASTPEADMPGMPMPQQESLGSAQPPDPRLTAKDWKPSFFDAHENETVIAISNLLIPDTDTPGAKAALCNRFIDLLLDASDTDTQKKYLEALGWLDGYCLSQYSRPFTRLGQDQQEKVLTLLTQEKPSAETAHGARLFAVIKESIVRAYYTSEIGLLQELKYQTNPYQPEFPGCKNPEEH